MRMAAIIARSSQQETLQARITYTPTDQYLHLTLWDEDYCLDRVSCHIDKALATLGVKFSRDFRLDLELPADED